MCGLAGCISIYGKHLNNPEVVDAMLKIGRHRGPDDTGVSVVDDSGRIFEKDSLLFMSNNVLKRTTQVFGFNRLSIQDLSHFGHQPMISNDKKIILSFNGEIYNASDFYEDLRNKGHCFLGKSDTEVVLHLYMEYGFEKTINLLNGMFAIVIADVEKKKVFFARDRFGIKPLYYYINSDNELYFASEIKNFLPIQELKKEIDKDALQEYFMYRCTDNRVLLKNVILLEPAQIMEVDTQCGDIRKYKFFDIDWYDRPRKGKEKFKTYQHLMNSILEKCVNRQMVGDVPLGVQLSGGVDSSLVSYYATQNRKGNKMDGISIVVDDVERNEERYIDYAAEKLEIAVHKFPMNEDIVNREIKDMIWSMESPIGIVGSMGIFQLCKYAGDYVTILLSGEGADELMGGYPQFAAAKLLPFWEIGMKVFPFIKKSKYQYKLYKGYKPQREYYAILAEADYGIDICQRFLKMFTPDKIIEHRLNIWKDLHGDFFSRLTKYSMKLYLPEVLLRQDKMSMAHSIENRVPFLDNEFVEFSYQIPSSMLIRFKWKGVIGLELVQGKYMPKILCSEKFGQEFAFRKKEGMGMPIKKYLKNDKFKNFIITDIIPKMETRGLFNVDTIKSSLQNIEALNKYETIALWKAVNLEIWCQLFLDKDYTECKFPTGSTTRYKKAPLS